MYNQEIQSDDTTRKPNILLLLFIILQIIVLILVIVTIFRFSQKERISETDLERHPTLSIDNLSNQVSTLQPDHISEIQRNLVYVLKKSYPNLDSNAEVAIRPDTLKTLHFDSSDTDYLSMIIDIEGVEYPYQIYYEYPDLRGNKGPNDFLSILCAPEASGCQDSKFQADRLTIAKRFLNQLDFEDFNAFIDAKTPNRIIIDAIHQNPSESTKKADLEKVKSAVDSLGISPDLFEYYFLQPSDITFHNEY